MDGHALPRDSVFFEHPLETLILGSVLETLSFTSPSHGGGQEFESPRAHPFFFSLSTNIQNPVVQHKCCKSREIKKMREIYGPTGGRRHTLEKGRLQSATLVR